MVVAFHVASGAAVGFLARSRLAAVVLGPVVHAAADLVPHEDISSRGFEIASGVGCVGLLAIRRGPLDPVTVGALSAAAPDLEHVFPWLRLKGRKLFHGRDRHRSGGVPVDVQLLLAGAIIGLLLSGRSQRTAAGG